MGSGEGNASRVFEQSIKNPRRVCQRCGAAIENSYRAKYCPDCREIVIEERWRAQYEQRKAAAKQNPPEKKAKPKREFKKICPYCKKEFLEASKVQKYCCQSCGARAYRAKKSAMTSASYNVDGRKYKGAPYLTGKRAPKNNYEWIIFDSYQARQQGLSYGQWKAKEREMHHGKETT